MFSGPPGRCLRGAENQIVVPCGETGGVTARAAGQALKPPPMAGSRHPGKRIWPDSVNFDLQFLAVSLDFRPLAFLPD